MLPFSLIIQIIGSLLSIILVTSQSIQAIQIWSLKKKSSFIYRSPDQTKIKVHEHNIQQFHFLAYKELIFDNFIKNQYAEELKTNLIIQSTGSIISATIACKKVSEIQFVLEHRVVSKTFAADQIRILTPTPQVHTAHCQFGCQCLNNSKRNFKQKINQELTGQEGKSINQF